LVNKSSVARRLAQLEKEGYVTREPDENDRRVLLVSPTKKAQELLPCLQEMAREWNEIITEGFTAEEIEVFATLIERACANAKRKAQELAQ
jgi:DNA-binding MarR family transcriptional regulator